MNNNFFDVLANSFDLVIVCLVLASGFFQKRYLIGVKLSKLNESLDSALKTLLVSFLVSTIYILLMKNPEKASNWAKYFLSYFFATSLYELLLDPFVKWIKKLTGNES